MHNSRFGEALRIRVKNFNQNLAENYSKSIEIALKHVHFFNFFEGSKPPDLPTTELSMDRNTNLFRQEYIDFLGTGTEMKLFVAYRNRNSG